MKKKTIYFHIGTHKTGTTALQKFFVANKGELNKNGIIYDFYNDSEMNQGYLVRPEKWDEIIFDKNNNYLISGEDFYSNILNIAETVKNKLQEFNIVFIVYFRRQDLMKESVYNQIVKMHGFFKEIKDDNHYNLDYYGFLKKLEVEFPNASVVVRAYEKNQFQGGSIYSDFLEILGIKLSNNFKIDKSVVNPSLTRDKLEFSRYINMLGLPEGLRLKLNKLVIDTVLEENEVQLFRKQDLISPKEAAELLNKYSKGNKKIAQEYLGRKNGVLFNDILPDDDFTWKAYSGLMIKDVEQLFIHIASKNKDSLEKLFEIVESTSDRKIEFVIAANLLMPILANILGKNFTQIKASDEKKNPFETIRPKINETSDSVDILREVAIAFKNNGDIETATKVMEQAYNLRPTGPVINQKLQEYRQILNKSEK